MRKRRLMQWLSMMMVTVLFITGCNAGNDAGQTGGDKEKDAENRSVEFHFWSAPNPSQQAFWTEMAEAYMAQHPDVKIHVSPMPETPSSEAGIQSAIAAGNAPTVSENISRGFAAQLAASGAIVPLDEFEGFSELVQSRQMSQTISGWTFGDDHQYVLPIYSNAMLFGWRIDILRELGYEKPPATYGEVLELGEKLKETHPDKFLWARADLVKPTWWARWFDFFMLYNAASGGNNFIQGSDLIADDAAGIKTLEFLQALSETDLLLTREATDPFETGQAVMMDIGPWTFPYWAEKFPEMKFGESYVLSMPPVPDNLDPAGAKTFADTKGISIYAQSSKEQQAAAFDFIQWVYADADHDLTWFKKTNLPPARDDLSSNETFVSYLEETPQLKPYAAHIPDAIPPIDNEKTVEIQELIGTEAVNPVVKGETDPQKAWEDMKQAVNEVLGK